MKTLKFRAWNIRDKKMYFFTLWESFCYKEMDFIAEPMQFTGLCDKNGKEIYEGDIFIAEVELQKYQAVVSFKNGGFSVPVIKENIGDCEVVGNIYESKHLLDNTDTKV